MPMDLQVGLTGHASLVVDAANTAGGSGATGVNVLGTPHLIGLLETAAWNAAKDHLQPGMVTVGSTVNVRHLAATPIGMTVTAHAELVQVDGRRLVFRLWAEDAVERISEGDHERFVVSLDKILEKARAKAEKAGR